MIGRSLVIAGLSMLVPVLAFAQSTSANTTPNFMGPLEPGSVTAGVKAGTLGIGAEIGYRANPIFGARIDGEGFSYDDNNLHAGRTNYNANLHLESYGALADVYPFGASFRVTGGLRLNENAITGHSVSESVGGATVPTSALATANAKITFDKTSPYVGFGWGGTITPGLNFTSDFGVMFHGNPKASLTATSTGVAPAASVASAAAEIASDQTSLQRDVNGYKYFPVIEIGLSYKF